LPVYDEFVAKSSKAACGDEVALVKLKLVYVSNRFTCTLPRQQECSMRSDPIQVTQQSEVEYPPPARFDEDASAHARPVEPIPTNQTVAGVERVRWSWLALETRTKRLAMILAVVLVMGAAVWALMMKGPATSNAESTPATEPAAEVSGAEVPASIDESPMERARAVSAQSARQIKRRTRESRPRFAPQRPRARLVAIIK
jgi:hypothetical protein